MKHSTLSPILSLALVGALGCEEQPAPTAPIAPSDDVAPQSRLDRLAFEDPGGDRATDRRIRELQQTQRRDPERLDGWILLGRAFVKKARQATEPAFYENARACAARALALRSDYPLALDLEAMVLMNQHRFAEAVTMVQRVLERDPDDVLALGTLADAALELGDVATAIEAADRMADLKPSLPAYARVAHLRWLHGDLEGAKAAYGVAMDAGRGASDPEPFAWVTTEAATLFLRLGDIEGAQVGFQKALDTLPGYPPARAGLGHVEAARGRFAAAADHYAASYADSALAETAWAWSQAAARAGRAEDAKRAHDKVVRLGAHGEGRVLAAMLAQENRQLAEARAAIEAELKSRGDYRSHDAHAFVLLRAGQLDAARAAMDRAMALGTPDPTLWAHDGLLRLAEGDLHGARRQLDRAATSAAGLSPHLSEEVARARRRLRG